MREPAEQAPEARRCPIRRMKKCRADCAWVNGPECAVMTLAKEAFFAVELLQAAPGEALKLESALTKD